MLYLESQNTDPHWNLALEQVVFDRLDRGEQYCMLWQNDNAIIVGKHQNTAGEINAAFMEEHGISVVRRLSGGGAVYHDLGNLNFTFVTDADGERAFDFAAFCRPVAAALESFGVRVQISGRNDMTIDGKKFSGNSQYVKRGRVLHHGTILYDSNLEMVSQALKVSGDKLESKGIQSVRSRVTNVLPYMHQPISVREFHGALRDFLFQELHLTSYTLTPEDLAAVEELRQNRYSRWDWNYGSSPAYRLHKERRVEGCGKLEVYLDVEKQGVLRDIAFYGDYFSSRDAGELAELLRGRRMEEGDLGDALADVELGAFFHGISRDEFMKILLQ